MSIEVRNLCAGYLPDVSILKDVSFDISDGSIVTVVGPNGSGKSTLLKAIMGFVVPSAGSVLVDEEPVDQVPVHSRAIDHGIAYVPQLSNVFGPLTVRENLELGGARLRSRSRRKKVAEMFDLYPQLGERQRQRADTQSGGERQMLAIARALMTEPRYLLLDEPSAGLSPLKVEELFTMLADMRTSHEVTLIVVEQNAAQSLSISDRGLVMVMGEIVLDEPANMLVDDVRISALYLGGASRQQ